MKKKFVAGLLTLGLVASLGVACNKTGSETEDGIVLVDFNATQTLEAADIGDLYELRRMVADEDGKEYVLSYEVKDSTGKLVSVVANTFEVTDLGGYTITYTVTVADGDVRTSVVTLPARDGDGPSILLGTLAAGEVNKEYVLPEIQFVDLSEITQSSVKVYFVDTELTEIALTEKDGKYSFLPTQGGTYRLSVTATDAAGNKTKREAEFSIEAILVGEVFNPSSAIADTKISFEHEAFSYGNNVAKEFVSAKDNDDEIYGGSYVRASATDTGSKWGKVVLTPRFDASAYASYDFINVWVYVESTASMKTSVLFLANAENQPLLSENITPNQWTLVSIDRAKFFEILPNSLYFISAKFTGEVTGIRIGEVLAVNNATVTVSAPADCRLNGEIAELEFTVTATPANTECEVTVTNAAGEEQAVVALGNGKYKATVSALGDYTIKASAINGKYGVATKTFSVLDPNRIVVNGEYADTLGLGEKLTVYGANVMRNDEVTSEVVSVKVYLQDGENWVDVSSIVANGKYKPTEEGKIKVEYTFETFAPITYEIAVFDYSVIFKPDSAEAASQVSFGVNNNVYQGTEKVFVTAEENTDETYGGAYLSATPTNPNAWGNLFIAPTFDVEIYEQRYDAVKAWIYIVASDNKAVNALFAYNNCTISVTTNQWVQVTIPMDAYVASVKTGTPVFVAINYNGTGVTGVRVGEVVAVNNVEFAISEPNGLILNGESTDVTFSVTATPSDTDYTVIVKNSAGEEQTVVALGNGNYKATVSALGNYTIRVTATDGKVGGAEKQFTVVESTRIVVDGEYEEAYGMGDELELLTANVMKGETITGEQVTVKVYAKDGESWVDMSSAIVAGTYKLTEEGKIKVEYTFGTLAPITYEIAVCDYSVIFKPDSAEAASQVVFGTNSKVYQGAEKVFVTAEENTDETYGGAYLSVTATDRNDGWGNLWIIPKFTAEDYASFDAVKAWVYIVAENNTDVNALFAMSKFTQVVTPNQWVQVTIPMGTYIESLDPTPVFIGLKYKDSAITGVRIGEISAEKFEEENDPSCVFNPASVKVLTQLSTSGKAFGDGANAVYTCVSAEENTDETYGEAYVRVSSTALTNANQWGNIFVTPTHSVESYAEYTTVKVWIYLESFADGDRTLAISGHTTTIAKNQWVMVEIPAQTYMTATAFIAMNMNQNQAWSDIQAIRIGEITAVK